MKQWHNWCLLGTVVFLAVFGGPMIINWLYQSNSGYITIWGAAEVFSYYGTILAAILAAIVAVVGVHISIRASHEQYREDKRRDVLPYFSINLLDRQSINPVDWESMHKMEMQNSSPEVPEYKEYPFDKNYFIFCDDELTCVQKLTSEQNRTRETGWNTEKRGECGEDLQPVFYIPIEMMNIGKGCAINTMIVIKSDTKNLAAGSFTVSIPIGEKIYVGLLIYHEASLTGTYKFEVQYSDIYGNKYVHRKSITVTKNKRGYNIDIDKTTTHEQMQ
ncbi:hypothetical protein K350107B32_01880 [Agathobaculum butyriciproducens]